MSKLRIEHRKALGAQWKDISAACGKLTVSGDLRGVAREVQVQVLRDGVDYYSGEEIKRGDALRITDLEEEREIFTGLVWDFTKSHNEPQAQVIAYDKLKFYMTSEIKEGSFLNKTPKEITEHLCKEVGVTFGECPDVDVKVKINCRGKTGYETLMQVWSVVKQTTGKPYYPVLKGGKLAIIEKGATVPLDLVFRPEPWKGTLLDISIHESSEEACSALILTDSEGNIKSEHYNKDLMKLYGYIQRVRDNNVTKDAIEINSGKVEVSCEAIGDWRVVTGYSVNLKSDFFTALMYIESDQHTYENGIHTMSLTLNYDNIMDEVENASVEQEENDFIESYSGEPMQYKAFGYCSCDICKSLVAFDASKKREKFKSVAVAPGVPANETYYIPYFKSMPGGGNYEACDRTIGMDDKTIGIYFDSHDEAVTFGKRELTVYKGGKRTVKKVPKESSGGRASGNSAAAKIFNLLRDLGYSSAAACGIIANLQRESGLNPTINEKGGTGNGRGLAQWDVRDRWQNLIRWCGENNLDYKSIEGQVRFIDYELTSGVLDAWVNQHGGLDALKNATEPEFAVAWFYDVFERGLNRASDIAKSNTIARGYFDKWQNLDEVSAGSGDFPEWTPQVPLSTNPHPNGKGYPRQCTWYVGDRLMQLGIQCPPVAMGNGGDWWRTARAYGITVHTGNPSPGEVLSFNGSVQLSAYGIYDTTHVAFVESVNDDGSFIVSEFWGSRADGVMYTRTFSSAVADLVHFIDFGI